MRSIPAMDALLSEEWTEPWLKQLGRGTVKRVFDAALAELRRRIAADEAPLAPDAIRSALADALARRAGRGLRRIINATGVVIHTNLGRSCLADEAVEAVRMTASRYGNLEYDVEEGTRGSRNSHVEDDVRELTGAEAALVVNNNAGAVLLCLSALAHSTEVVVSRGELVEIGGAFRVPDIMAFSGALLVEVGTTNRTHLSDYEAAITDRTSMLLKVHPSNFRIIGFTSAPKREDMAALAHSRGLVMMEDAGSGLLVDGADLGLSGEASVGACIASGCDLVTFSGDKMLGGPQIGVIVGKKCLVDQLRNHPAARALRVDKMTLAAFAATARLYRLGELDRVPTLAMLRRSGESMEEQARRIASAIGGVAVQVEDAVGGGSHPEHPIPGWGAVLPCGGAGGAGRLLAALRSRSTPILCGARGDAAVIHVRTLLPGDEEEVIAAFQRLVPN
ncbi:MAG: L-seryl-tRNA(Sec) selenium transferase [Synergistaceae bacterium]|jgi:L-seryl-tRNA(Ser) seleniumtransferase|nr:L-seryl-tRNA(Sec) selenium transferase [Synergistaceae bacterium]